MADEQRRDRKKTWIWGTVVGLVLAAGIAFWFRSMSGKSGLRLGAEQCQLLHQWRNTGIGYLENEQFDEAAATFRKIIEELPAERLPHQNLAVGQLMATDAGKADAQSALDAIDGLLAIAPTSATAHLLKARLHLLLMERATDAAAREVASREAMTALKAAASADPTNSAVQYALYEAGRYSQDAATKLAAQQALGETYRLQPNNLFVLADWLVAQAENQDPSIVGTLKEAKVALAPVREGIRRRAGADIFEFLDKATAAVDQEQWNVVLANCRVVGNAVRPDDYAQSDKRLVTPHPLEFVIHDFSPAFYEQSCQPTPRDAVPLDVRWRQFPAESQPPLLADVVDVLLVDFNLDGRLDLVVLQPAKLTVLSRGDGGESWQTIAELEVGDGMRGIVAADLDRDDNRPSGHAAPAPEDADAQDDQPRAPRHDADVDLIVFGDGGLVVLRNDLAEAAGQRTLVPIEQDEAMRSLRNVAALTFIDYDHDGDLDLAVASDTGVTFWANRGDMTFADQTQRSQLPPADAAIVSMTAVDWDRDVDLDLVVAGTGNSAVGYLENLRHGQFRWRPFDQPDSASAVAVLEADGNASWDFVTAGSGGTNLYLTATPRAGTVAIKQTRTLSSGPPDTPVQAAGIRVADLDNNGFQDAILVVDGRVSIFAGGPAGEMQETNFSDESFQNGVTVFDVGDVDGDGDLDLVLATGRRLVLLANETNDEHRWLDVRLKGAVDNKSGRVNHLGIGSLLEIRSGEHYQAQVVSRPTTHFGLGKQAQADVVRVLMTNGIPQAIINPEVDQVVLEEMALKGSCPYAYTWNGERFEFFTDLLWAAPIGLQFAEDVIAPARPWEYLKLPGEQLRPKNGRYEIRVTEELWEAAYFDQIELLAVDHPSDVEVFSNEKVGPAEIAEFQIHTVRQRRQPVAARDQHGRDVLETIVARDDVYFQGFERRYCQGLVEPHYLELDLGELAGATRIRLFLTGWIFPTDTSLNIALSQDPTLTGPAPPSILVPDTDRQWQVAVPFMGFPGGKTKTIVVDISTIFPSDDYRLRIATSNEIYWDEVFFTVDEDEAAFNITPLPLLEADLHFRGFSQISRKRQSAPEIFQYDQIDTHAKWPPMRGNFTRYGDVRPLLTKTDDRLLVMASGDEVSLSFAVPERPLPAGWTRDFILHNVGWDKDADLNTIYGQTVEPLPWVGMEKYPFAAESTYPNSEAFREYLREYQTRRQSFADFWKGTQRD